jgi:hypothetical protein
MMEPPQRSTADGRIGTDEAAIRQRLVATGVDVLYAEGVTTGLDRVTFPRVIRLAGIDHRAAVEAYAEAETLPGDAFHRDLLTSFFARDNAGWEVPTTLAEIEEVIASAGDDVRAQPVARRRAVLRELIRRASAVSIRLDLESRRFQLTLALSGAITSQRRPAVDTIVRALHEHWGRAERPFDAIYERIGDALGFVPRPGFSFSLIAGIAEDLSTGMVVSHNAGVPLHEIDVVDPETGDTETWHPFAAAMWAVVDAMLMPFEASEPN